MTHPNARQAEVEREGRRRQVAALLLAGVSDQTKIAQELGVSNATISRDIKVIESDWQASAVQDIAAAKGKDLQRTERLIQALWQDAVKGKWLATDRVLSLMQHRAKLLGLNAPEKREHTGRDGAPIEHITRSVIDTFAPEEIIEIADRLAAKSEGVA